MGWERKCISRSIGWVLSLPGSFFSLLDSGGKAVGWDRAVDYLWVADPRRGRMEKRRESSASFACACALCVMFCA